MVDALIPRRLASGWFIASARNKFPLLKFSEGKAEKTPYEDNIFDIVFSINTLFYTDIEKSIPEFCRVLKNGGLGAISFDIKIFDLDNNKEFHQESLEHLRKVLKKCQAEIIFLGNEETRFDETPFKHEHTFYKIVFKKV